MPDGNFNLTTREGLSYFFNVNGKLVSVSDRLNRTTTFAYQNNLVSSITNSSGQTTQFSYSGDKLSSFTDPAQRTTTFNYTSGNLTHVVFSNGSNKSFSYDNEGKLISETDESGNSTNYEYNQLGRIFKIRDPLGKTTQVSDFVSLTYQSPKREGLTGTNTATTSTNANNSAVSLTKDANGFIRKIKDPLGRITEIVSDFEGKPTLITKPDNTQVEFSYNSSKDLIQQKNLQTGVSIARQFNQYGQVVSEKDSNNNTKTNTYSADTGLLTQSVFPNDVRINYLYNTVGLITTKTTYPENGQQVTLNYEYDQLGNVKKIITSDGKYSEFTNDLAGNTLSVKKQIDQNNFAITYYEYDLFNRLTKVTSAKNEVTRYEYSITGDLLKIIDPQNKETLFNYDKNHRLISKINHDGATYLFEYDNMGNLIKEIDPNGQMKMYSYNSNNKMISAQFSDESLQYNYDLNDRLTDIISNNEGRISYSYDQNNQLAQEVSQLPTLTYAVSYIYDANGNKLRSTINSAYVSAAVSVPTLDYLNQINYAYDENNRLTQLSNIWGDQFNFSYDQSNRLIKVTRPGSFSEYTYNNGSELNSITHKAGTTVKSFVNLTYDTRHLINRKTSLAETTDINYDANGFVIQANNLTRPDLSESFNYDALGNRLSFNTTHLSYDTATLQKLIDDGQFTYLYDNNGNVIAKNSKTNGTSYQFEYNSRNQLKLVLILSAPLGQVQKTLVYKYDPVGRRRLKAVTDNLNTQLNYTRKYIYDGDNIIAEADSDNRMLASYTYSPLSADDILSVHLTGGQNNSMSSLNDNFYFLKDHLNSVTDIISSSGSIVQSYDYSIFGSLRKIKNSSGTEINFSDAPIKTSFSFTAREYEPETGLYYYRARYYDPSVGRFLQQDPDPGKLANPSTFLSKYVYCANNPVSMSDPSGRFFFLAIFLGSFLLESSLAVTLLAGASAALAAVELSKYHGNTGEMLNKENPWSLVGTAISGAFFSWAGGAMTTSFLNSSTGLAMSRAVGIGATRFTTGFVANGLASVGMTGYFDATNTLNVSGQDYANALIFGGLAGGGVEFSNWYFYSHIATPLAISANGAISITIDYVPEQKER